MTGKINPKPREDFFVLDVIRPGWRSGKWHPQCLAPVDQDGAPLSASFPAEEIDLDLVEHCGCVDVAVSHVEGEGDWPTEWTCPRCGTRHVEAAEPDRATFEWVRARDHGLAPEAER